MELVTAANEEQNINREQRIPSKQTASSSEATPSASAQGIEGGGPGENPDDLSAGAKGESHVDEAEQMGAPGEGKVADAVKDRSKGNSGTSQDGMESDLDRKKAEQAPRREAVQKEEKKEVDVGGVLGQRGGPASSVS